MFVSYTNRCQTLNTNTSFQYEVPLLIPTFYMCLQNGQTNQKIVPNHIPNWLKFSTKTKKQQSNSHFDPWMYNE